jgi:hypothetical protein
MRPAQAIVHRDDVDVSDDHDAHDAGDDHRDDAEDDRADGDHADDDDDQDDADDAGSHREHADDARHDDDHAAGCHAAGSRRTRGHDVAATATARACRGSAVDDLDAHGADAAGDHAAATRRQGRGGGWPKRSRAQAQHRDTGRCCAVRRLS